MVSLRQRFQINPSLDTLLVDSDRVTAGHFAFDESGRVFRLLALLLDFIRQAGVCDGDLIRLQAAPNKLALDAKSCEIRA